MLTIEKKDNITYILIKPGYISGNTELINKIKHICMYKTVWEIIEPSFIQDKWWDYAWNSEVDINRLNIEIARKILYYFILIENFDVIKNAKVIGYIKIEDYNKMYNLTYSYMKNLNKICKMNSIEININYRRNSYGDRLIKFAFNKLKQIGYDYVFLDLFLLNSFYISYLNSSYNYTLNYT